jgi:uroporphyrinogen-III decarboxylase
MMAEISSKELVRNLFRLKEIPRIPFIPWVGTFAAKLDQIPVQDMLSDPGSLSTALMNCQELFGYDAIVTVFDTSLEAEACGCEINWAEDQTHSPQVVSHILSNGASLENMDIQNLEKRGRIPVYIEAIKRINIVKGKQIAILGMVTGPFTLAHQLMGDNFEEDIKKGTTEATKAITLAGSIGLKLCRTYCELGVDGIVINDEQLGKMDERFYAAAAASLKSIWNVVKFFDVRSLILTGDCATNKTEPIIDLQADGVALGAKVDAATIREIATTRKVCYGLSVPTEVIQSPDQSLIPTDISSPVNRKGCFLTTDGEVPYETDVETMQKIMESVHPG